MELQPELIPHLLPVVRRIAKGRGRGTFVAIFPEGILVGREANAPAFDAAESLHDAHADLDASPTCTALKSFPFDAIASLQIAPIQGTATSRLEVRAATGDTWSGRVPFTPESLPAELLRRLSLAPLQVVAARRRLRSRLLVGALLVVTGLIWFGAVAAAIENELRLAGLVFLLGLLTAFFARLAWRAKPATAVPPAAPSSAQPRPPAARRRPSPRWGLVLRLLGAAALVGGYFASGWLIDAALVAINNAGRPIGSSTGYVLELIRILCYAPAVYLVVQGYLLSQRDGGDVLRDDPRPPILFLRSFGDDERHTFTEESEWADLCALVTPSRVKSENRIARVLNYKTGTGRLGGILSLPFRLLMLVLGRGADTAEEQLAHALRPVGPVVAVGNPNEPFPTPGAARLFLSHDEWQERVSDLIARSRLVIIQPSNTEGVWWEMRTIRALLEPHRVVISLIALTDEDVRDVCLARMGLELGRRLPRSLAEAPLLRLDDDWTPRPIPFHDANPFVWPWIGTSVNLRRSLRPVLAQIEARESGAADAGMAWPESESAHELGEADAGWSARRPAKRPAKFAAGALYGLLPLLLIIWAHVADISAVTGGPGWSGRQRVFESVAYRMPLDAQWVQSHGVRTGDPFDAFAIGRLRRHFFLVMTTDRDSEGGLLPWAEESFRGATALWGESESIGMVARPTVERHGGWPWTQCTMDVREAGGRLSARLWVWVLESSRHRYVVFASHTRDAADLYGGEVRTWDERLPAEVRRSLDGFVPSASVHDTSGVALLSEEVPSTSGRFVFRRPAGWEVVESGLPAAELALAFGDSTAIHLGFSDAGSVDNPVAIANHLVATIGGAVAGAAVRATAAGWATLDGLLVLNLTLVVESPGAPTEYAEVFLRNFPPSGVSEIWLITTNPDPAARERALRDARAVVASVRVP